jgi:hypothetical protein
MSFMDTVTWKPEKEMKLKKGQQNGMSVQNAIVTSYGNRY